MLSSEIIYKLIGGIQHRVVQPGDVPGKNPFREFYCIELTKEINDLPIIEKRGSKLIRRRNDYIVSFVIVYVLL